MKTGFLKYCFLFFVFLISCQTDDFSETERIILTDKNSYNIGDTIRLTLKIIPKREKRKIRIYKNYKNLEVSYTLVNRKTGVFNQERSEDSGENLPETSIKTVLISKEKPFEKTFQVFITSKGEKIILNIPELKMRAEYDSERLKNDTLRIHGFCRPIRPMILDSLEDYFEVKDIVINVEQEITD